MPLIGPVPAQVVVPEKAAVPQLDVARFPVLPASAASNDPIAAITFLRGLSSALPGEEAPASEAVFDNKRRLASEAVVSGGNALDPELVQLLKDVIGAPSVKGVHPEKGVADAVQRFAQDHGIRVERFEGSPGRPVLKLSVGPENVPGLILVAHTDTVSAGDESRWKYPPFAATVVNGKLYGRGAVDDKGGLVAAMGALLKAKQLAPQRSLALLAVPDEEAGATGKLGIRLLHEKGKLQGLGAIYTYPGLDHIIVGHRGVWRFKIDVQGKSFHTGSRQWQQQQGRGANALTGAAEVVLAIEGLSNRLQSQRGSGLYAGHTTVLSPVVVNGGQSYGMTPENVQLQVDGRLIPDLPVVKTSPIY